MHNELYIYYSNLITNFCWIVVAVTLLFIHIKSPKKLNNQTYPVTVKRVTATTTQLKLQWHFIILTSRAWSRQLIQQVQLLPKHFKDGFCLFLPSLNILVLNSIHNINLVSKDWCPKVLGSIPNLLIHHRLNQSCL